MARPGDTISCKGTIINKYDKDGEYFVDCEIYAENQRGEKCAIGQATAGLSTRASHP